MIAWHEEGRFPAEKLITHYAYEDINKAFEDLNSGKVIKAVLDMPQ
jgi:aryl-alcohol dehydrogenase